VPAGRVIGPRWPVSGWTAGQCTQFEGIAGVGGK